VRNITSGLLIRFWVLFSPCSLLQLAERPSLGAIGVHAACRFASRNPRWSEMTAGRMEISYWHQASALEKGGHSQLRPNRDLKGRKCMQSLAINGSSRRHFPNGIDVHDVGPLRKL
jgi:hypothetical protein